MMKKPILSAVQLSCVFSLMLVIFSCNKETAYADLNEQQKLNGTELKTILETDDISSVVDDVVTDLYQNSVSGKSSNIECYTPEYTDTGFTVSFDNCSVEGSEAVSGMLSVVYIGTQDSNEFTATFTALSVGDIEVDGTRSYTLSGGEENIAFTIISDMSITLADGNVVEETGTKSFAIQFDTTTITDSMFSIEGNWTVKADGNTYVIDITSALKSALSCTYVAEGSLTLIKNGLAVDVIFGDGTCDDLATVIYPDNTEEEISLKD